MIATKAANLPTIWLGLMILCIPFSSHAEIKWKFSSDSTGLCIPDGCGGTYTDSLKFEPYDTGGDPAVNVNVTAWADTRDSGAIEQAYVGGPWSGLGVKNKASSSVDPHEGSSPEHAMDNDGDGRRVYDTLRFDFDSAIRLTKVVIGWYQNDSDISVLAYTGNGDSSIDGKDYADLNNMNGWELINSYENLHNSGNTANISGDTGGVFSSSWLVAIYNPAFGSEGWERKSDYVKIKKLFGEKGTNQVPEPSSIVLFLLALPLLRYFRRDRLGQIGTLVA